MKIAIIQLNADSNKQNNIQNACNLVNKASNKNVDLILLPEVFNYRGPLIKRDLYQKIAEEIPGQSLVPLMEIALKNYQSTAGSLFLFDGVTLILDKIKLTKNQLCSLCSNLNHE